MKKIFVCLLLAFLSVMGYSQNSTRINVAITGGSGIDLGKTPYTPVTGSVCVLTNVFHRFDAGIGLGISSYERVLLPIFADIKFRIIKPHLFTPYLECAAGYALALENNASGGFYVNPLFGVEFAFRNDIKIFLNAGYEYQSLTRLKKNENEFFKSEFIEQLNHHIIAIKIGLLF